jgi:hypothetical protein
MRPVDPPMGDLSCDNRRGMTIVTHSTRTVLLTLAVGSLSVAATRFVAMRVDIEALRAAGQNTVVEVGIQIAPEDRSVIGRRVVLQMELTRDKTTVDRVARSIELDSDGRARIEVVWPPGVYEVRVEVESASGEDSGLWLGKTRVPRLEPEAPAPPPTSDAAEVAAAGGGAAAASAAPLPGSDVTSDPEPTAQAAQPPTPVVEETPGRAEAPAPAFGARVDDPSLADLTVLVTYRNRPVSGLDRDDLELRVNGGPTAVDSMGSAADTPLFLGVAVDMSAPMTAQMPDVSRTLSGLAVRTLGVDGGLFLVSASPDPKVTLPWGATPSDLANALAESGDSPEADVTGLITTALGQFEGRTGRKFLIVVTDGGRVSSKSDWQDVAPIVDAAGVPIFVLGVRAESLNDRMRRSLDRLAATTGGKSYFVQDTGMLSMTTDHIADLISGSYAIRFQRPTGSGLHKVSVSTGNKDQTVLHPRTVR